MNNKDIEKVVCENKVVNGKRIAWAIKELVNKKRLNLKRGRMLHKSFFILNFMYEYKTIVWEDKHWE